VPFVSIEGIDGSGKSTQVEKLVLRLEAAGLDVLRTKEPDGGRIGLDVRSIMTARDPRLSGLEELLLVSAARVDHIRSIIRPALAAGRWVVSDRFVDSSFALQVIDGGVSEATYQAIASEVVGDTLPDLTFILDLTEELAVSRREARRTGAAAADPAEASRDFHRIREGYLEVARRYPGRCRVIDAATTPEHVHEAIWQEIEVLTHGRPCSRS
jgi:dTMP kinase